MHYYCKNETGDVAIAQESTLICEKDIFVLEA
jgi:hypothetical protein